MKNFRYFLAAAVCACAVLSSCSHSGKAVVNGSFDTVPSVNELEVKVIGDTSIVTADVVKIAADGSFKYKREIEKGQPEFVYLYYGSTKVASLLLEAGDKVNVKCDTLGGWTVEGSQACEDVRANELALATLIRKGEITAREFIDHYRSMTRYVLGNPFSMAVYPVFNQKIGDVYVFGQYTDAVVMQQVADSLATVYPESRFTKALRNQADARFSQMSLMSKLAGAESASYPELSYPDVDGNMVKLSDVATDRTVIVFWSSAIPVNKVYNQDVLVPLYKQMAGKGVSIYSVSLRDNITDWTSCILDLKMPWTNVLDQYGLSISMYGVQTLPTVFVLKNKTELTRLDDMSLDGLKKALK